MSGRDLLHSSAEHIAAVQSSHPGGALRVLLPIARLHATSADTALGSDILRVEAAASGIRAELNAALPELASWWTTPTLWLAPQSDPGANQPTTGEVSVSVESFHQVVSDAIGSLLGWAEQVIVVSAALDREQLSPTLRALRQAEANVLWVTIEHGPDATFDAVDAVRFGKPGDDGYLEPPASA
ncbi:hypothetical protein [Pontimonas sp.]|jgi:hypothetical protein|uniref:hypothetical protein n=1 Tax=Pontimonas sp. TaxID=2304492 RepID=UPI0028705E8E|nr:hypothetical protein [Pontimonas sp.]MDR9396588.1 hypothetical protein [Pontimonas sp.]